LGFIHHFNPVICKFEMRQQPLRKYRHFFGRQITGQKAKLLFENHVIKRIKKGYCHNRCVFYGAKIMRIDGYSKMSKFSDVPMILCGNITILAISDAKTAVRAQSSNSGRSTHRYPSRKTSTHVGVKVGYF